MNAASRGTTGSTTFTRLLEMLRPDLVRFAYWLARDRSVAEDVVQETLIRAWKSRQDLKDPTAARPWLFTIARREHARLYERKRLPTVDVNINSYKVIARDFSDDENNIVESSRPSQRTDAIVAISMRIRVCSICSSASRTDSSCTLTARRAAASLQ